MEKTFHQKKMIGKKFEKNNVTIALNISYAKKEKIYPAYISKHNSNREKQVILLMISNREERKHFVAVKKISALLRGTTSKHHDDFYCLNYVHCFAAENQI